MSFLDYFKSPKRKYREGVKSSIDSIKNDMVKLIEKIKELDEHMSYFNMMSKNKTKTAEDFSRDKEFAKNESIDLLKNIIELNRLISDNIYHLYLHMENHKLRGTDTVCEEIKDNIQLTRFKANIEELSSYVIDLEEGKKIYTTNENIVIYNISGEENMDNFYNMMHGILKGIYYDECNYLFDMNSFRNDLCNKFGATAEKIEDDTFNLV